jgi:hypothetical protein
LKIFYIGFKGSSINIKYENGFDKCQISSDEKAKPEFYTAFSGLKNVFDEIAELPSSYDKIFVTSIAITYENEDIKSVIVCGEMKLKKSLGSLKIQTPLKNYEDMEGVADGLSYESRKTIKLLIEEACDFVSGDRNQPDLFNKKGVKTAKEMKKEKDQKNKKIAKTLEAADADLVEEGGNE